MMRTILVLLVIGGCAPRTSTQRINYPNGAPHFEYALKDGLPHGDGRVWYPNGQLRSEGPYVNGVKHGVFTFYTDGGTFEHQALFWNDVEVWRSNVASDRPSPQLVAGLTNYAGDEPRLGADFGRVEVSDSPGYHFSSEPPAPFFASLDRTTSLNRVGTQIGFGDADGSQFGSVLRYDVYGNYRLPTSPFGVYGQFSQAQFETSGMRLPGRRTLELGGAYHRGFIESTTLSGRAGLLVPIGHDDDAGFIAGSAGSFQRVTDAAASIPSTVALRTGASITRSHTHVVWQGDAGIDWLFGGEASSVDALVRANAGVGVGVRSALMTLELDNTMRVSDPSRHLHVIGLGGTFWLNSIWVNAFGSRSFDGNSAIMGSVGYEL